MYLGANRLLAGNHPSWFPTWQLSKAIKRVTYYDEEVKRKYSVVCLLLYVYYDLLFRLKAGIFKIIKNPRKKV